MVIFKLKPKKFEGALKKYMVKDYILLTSKCVKYLGVKNLSWQCHANDLSIKLNIANALLFKIRK